MKLIVEKDGAEYENIPFIPDSKLGSALYGNSGLGVENFSNSVPVHLSSDSSIISNENIQSRLKSSGKEIAKAPPEYRENGVNYGSQRYRHVKFVVRDVFTFRNDTTDSYSTSGTVRCMVHGSHYKDVKITTKTTFGVSSDLQSDFSGRSLPELECYILDSDNKILDDSTTGIKTTSAAGLGITDGYAQQGRDSQCSYYNSMEQKPTSFQGNSSILKIIVAQKGVVTKTSDGYASYSADQILYSKSCRIAGSSKVVHDNTYYYNKGGQYGSETGVTFNGYGTAAQNGLSELVFRLADGTWFLEKETIS